MTFKQSKRHYNTKLEEMKKVKPTNLSVSLFISRFYFFMLLEKGNKFEQKIKWVPNNN